MLDDSIAERAEKGAGPNFGCWNEKQEPLDRDTLDAIGNVRSGDIKREPLSRGRRKNRRHLNERHQK